jgi:urease beta subunit
MWPQFRLGPPSASEPGDEKAVTLVEVAGAREVHGLNALAEGKVDAARRTPR